MPAPIKKLADKFLDNPRTIEVARAATTNANIAQWLVPTAQSDKRATLRDLLRQEEVRTAIIFCNRKTTVRELNKSLKRSGFRSGEIHGDMEQPQRLAELDLFKTGEINILVASDVAARGLDIKGVSHVFNFDAPWHPDDYVHRIGRTGRAGATGIAYTFVTADDAENVANIEKLTGQKIARIESAPKAPAPAEDEPAREEKPRRGRRRGQEPAPAERRKPERRNDTRPAARNEAPDLAEEPDTGGWNGPVPGFLSARIDL
jgi:superfamily II DNA/RNA helicase